jgi:predicted O-linked N-acetylglucosamine transferase (SPINDLY family)
LTNPAALFQRAVQLYQGGRLADAEASCRLALTAMRHPDVLNLLGLIVAQRGNLDEAERVLNEAVKLAPRSVEARTNLAQVYALRGRLEDSVLAYGRALLIQPNFVLALNNRGTVLRKLKRFDEALTSLNKALAIKPDYADALFNRGNVLADLRRPAEALTDYERALSIHPRFADAMAGRGYAQTALGRCDLAMASFDAALAIKPNNIEALCGRGQACIALARFDEALDSFRKALAIDPDSVDANVGILFPARAACDWSREAELLPDLRRKIESRKWPVPPFTLLSYVDDPVLQLQCARIQSEQYATSDGWPRRPPSSRERIRVAYLSADFHRHVTAYLMAEMFELHDRARFETVAISYGPDDQSDMRRRLVTAFDRFEDVRLKSDRDVAKLIHDLEIDIAVDLKGHTGGARTGILASRPAPIQASYMGYTATTGTDFIDYIIADRIVAPLEQQPFFSEKIVHLPPCYMVSASTIAVPDSTPTREQIGLPNDAFVFCSFNNTYKITPPIFKVWMNLLREVEGSVLWLLRGPAEAERNLRAEAGRQGIAPARIVFAERTKEPADHLARHRLADLFVDTHHVNAHTTAAESLRMGLPLVTCPGRTFITRVAASMLTAAGLPELIATSLEDYQAIAIRLARDPTALAEIRDRLRAALPTCPLFDTARFTRHFEQALSGMWQRHLRGAPPASFAIEP